MKKLIPSSKLFSCMLLMCGASAQANAATITWNAIQTVTGNASDVVTTGTFVDSATIHATTNVTLNGVTFKRYDNVTQDGTFIGSNITYSGMVNDDTRTHGVPSGFDADYQTLLGSGGYSGGSITITLGGLTDGQDYLVQVWQPYWDLNWMTGYDAGNDSGLLDTGEDGTTVSQYVVGTFTAVGTTQTIQTNGPSFNVVGFMQVRAIPEPSSALLGGLGLLALLRRRR
jgi:hypothetical protein